METNMSLPRVNNWVLVLLAGTRSLDHTRIEVSRIHQVREQRLHPNSRHLVDTVGSQMSCDLVFIVGSE